MGRTGSILVMILMRRGRRARGNILSVIARYEAISVEPFRADVLRYRSFLTAAAEAFFSLERKETKVQERGDASAHRPYSRLAPSFGRAFALFRSVFENNYTKKGRTGKLQLQPHHQIGVVFTAESKGMMAWYFETVTLVETDGRWVLIPHTDPYVLLVFILSGLYGEL